MTPDSYDALRTRISELRREVYSRAGADSPLVEAMDPVTGHVTRLRSNELELRLAERELAERELAAAPPIVAPADGPTHPLPPAAPPAPTLPDPTVEPEFVGQSPARISLGRRQLVGGSVIALVLISAVAIGSFSFGKSTVRPTPTARTGLSAIAGSGTTSAPVTSPPALDIFLSPQTPFDVPDIVLDPEIDRTTVRSFPVFPSQTAFATDAPEATPDDSAGSRAQSASEPRKYAAMTTARAVCLIVVFSIRLSSYTCTSQSQFVTSGLSLGMHGVYTEAPGEVGVVPTNWDFFWSADGSVSSSAGPVSGASTP